MGTPLQTADTAEPSFVLTEVPTLVGMYSGAFLNPLTTSSNVQSTKDLRLTSGGAPGSRARSTQGGQAVGSMAGSAG